MRPESPTRPEARLLGEGPRHGRVVVCVGAAGIDMGALRVAAGLAAGLSATLAGIYIEEERLQRVAVLPFTREFSLHSPGAHDFSLSNLRRSQRAQAEQLRRTLAALAEPMSLIWTMDIVQGNLPGASFARMSATDLMVVGRPQFLPPAGETMAASTVKPYPAALARYPVAVLYDGSQEGLRALTAALALVRITGSDLVVVIVADDDASFQIRKRQAEHQLDSVRAHFHRATTGNWQAAEQAAMAHGATALIRPRSDADDTGASGVALPTFSSCSLVLIH